jgi:hypothetical protein
MYAVVGMAVACSSHVLLEWQSDKTEEKSIPDTGKVEEDLPADGSEDPMQSHSVSSWYTALIL